MTSPIALVLDPHFAGGVLGLAKEMPVWIVSSNENDEAVEHTRRLLGGAASVTTLFVAQGEAPADTLLNGLYEIDEHHGQVSMGEPYDQVLVFGSNPDLLPAQLMTELGFEKMIRSAGGFSMQKQSRHRVTSTSP